MGSCVLASGAGAFRRRGACTPQWADSALAQCSPGRLLGITGKLSAPAPKRALWDALKSFRQLAILKPRRITSVAEAFHVILVECSCVSKLDSFRNESNIDTFLPQDRPERA
jgi:hypothetical protein